VQIFISYSSKDRETVRELVADLTEMGHTVWFDQRLVGGDAWWQTILDHLRRCDVVVATLSENYLNSHPCQLEYDYAARLGKPIIPVTDFAPILRPSSARTNPNMVY